MRKQISFKTTKAEFDQIAKIADRVENLAKRYGADYNRQTCLMDLTATHMNGCPLDLGGLLAASDGDFVHDVWGIRIHLDRETGELKDCFIPRYARKYAEASHVE